MIAPPVIMKFGIPLLRIEPAAEEISIQSLGEMNSSEMPTVEPVPLQDSVETQPAADVSVQ